MKAIDLFAGAGGFTEGAEQAGLEVVWAANHWQTAVDTHKLNHPETAHSCQDLHQANFYEVPDADIVLASPCCQGHSKAKGKEQKRHDASRSTAWAVVTACEAVEPEIFVIENVPEFQDWTLYPEWCSAMKRLGFSLSTQVQDAADSGVPQNRKRLFIVGTRSKTPINLNIDKQQHVPASSFLDFDTGNWSKVYKEGRAADTIARYESGKAKFGDRFLMPYYKSGSGKTGRSIDRPIGTITCKARWAVARGDEMRMLTTEETCKAMGFPESYQLPKRKDTSIHLLGNAVPPPLARDVINAVLKAA